MMDYHFNGQTFQVDRSKCDGSADWEVKVTDGKSNAVITWDDKRLKYRVEQVEGDSVWTLPTESQAVAYACNALNDYSERAGITPEQAFKALEDYIEQSGK